MEYYDENEPLDISEQISTYLRKGDYESREVEATILDFKPANQFGLPEILIQIHGEYQNQIMNLSKINLNQIINLFGKIPKNWKNQVVRISFSQKKLVDPDNPTKKGVTCSIHKV